MDRKPATQEEIAKARATYADDNVEVDDDAEASHAVDGIWVTAWVWIPK